MPPQPPRGKRRPPRGDDAAASALISFLVAVGLFVVAFSLITVVLSGYVAHAAVQAQNLDPVAEDALQVLTSSTGSPADWCHDTSVDRVGLLKDGTGATVDLCKLRALENGNVSYDGLRSALGLHQREVHLRTYPAYVLAADGSSPSLHGFRVLYVGHRSTLGGLAPEAATEAGTLGTVGASFNATLYQAGDGTGNGGSILRDGGLALSRNLGVRLLGFVGAEDGNTSLLPVGTNDTSWRVVSASKYAPVDRLDDAHPFVLTTSVYEDSAWTYAEGTDDRVVLAHLDLRSVDPSATVKLHLDEFVQGAPNGLGQKDSGTIEIRQVGSPTWTPIWGGIHDLGSLTSFSTRSYTLNGTAGKNFYVALRWTTGTHVSHKLSAGWFLTDPSVTVTNGSVTQTVWQNPMNLNRTSVDALVVGSNVDESSLEGIHGDLGPVVQAWIQHGGDLVALGTATMDTSWIPQNVTAHAGPNGPLLTDASDLSHPVLTTPNLLDYMGWPSATASYDVPDSAAWTKVLLTSDTPRRSLLSVSNLEPGLKGTMILSSHQPYRMDPTDSQQFLENSLLYERFHELYLDYGPSETPGAPVGSATFRGLVDATPLGLSYQDMNVVLYVWGGN